MEPEGLSPYTQEPATCPYHLQCRSCKCPQSYLNKIHFNIILPLSGSVRIRGLYNRFVTWLSFYGEEFSAPRPIPNLEDHPLSAARDSLFNTFAATLHIWTTFLYPQSEDAACRGDRNPLFTDDPRKFCSF
jgi:hypothetical protein